MLHSDNKILIYECLNAISGFIIAKYAVCVIITCIDLNIPKIFIKLEQMPYISLSNGVLK